MRGYVLRFLTAAAGALPAPSKAAAWPLPLGLGPLAAAEGAWGGPAGLGVSTLAPGYGVVFRPFVPFRGQAHGASVAYLFRVDGRRPGLESGEAVKVIYFPVCCTCCWKG